MSFRSIADSGLSLATTIGFAQDGVGWKRMAIAAAATETLIDVFFPPSQDAAITAVYEVRDELLKAMSDEGEQILAGVWQDFAKEHLADVKSSMTTYGTYITRLLAWSGAKEGDVVGTVENADFMTAVVPDVQLQTGSGSPLTRATGFIEVSAEGRNTSVHLYLLAATWYLSWCKLALLLEWMKIESDYREQLTKYKADHPDWKAHLSDVPTIPDSSADLTGSVYIAFMQAHLPGFLAYAAPIVSTLVANLKALDDALEKRARDFTIEHGPLGWFYRDGRTGNTGAPTANRASADAGMQLQIGIAQGVLKSQMLKEPGLLGVDRDQVTTSLQTLDEFRHAATTYGIDLDQPATTFPSR